MAKVECEVRAVTLTNARGFSVESVEVECTECGRCEQSFGTGKNSITRCLMLLKENCKTGQRNFYVAEED